MINFNDPNLLRKYGNWVKVQVAFYDFLFRTATELEPSAFNKLSTIDEFADGEDAYDMAIKMIDKTFLTPEKAFEQFKKEAWKR